MNCPPFHYMNFSISLIIFILKSLFLILLSMLSFGYHLPEMSFLHSFAVNLCGSLRLKWVSCRQHINGSCSFIHSTIICLLFELFILFINKYLLLSFSRLFYEYFIRAIVPFVVVNLLSFLCYCLFWDQHSLNSLSCSFM